MNREQNVLITRLEQLERGYAQIQEEHRQLQVRHQQSEQRYHQAERRFRLLGSLALAVVIGALLLSPASHSLADGYGTTLSSLLTQMTTAETNITGLQSNVSTLQTKTQYLSVSGTNMKIIGANLWIQSGSGSTDGTINGLGNLIIGYNELRNNSSDKRTGSHNLIVGKHQSYSSYGGLVAGYFNTISGAYASISCGRANTSSGVASSVSGGQQNTASGGLSSVSGGLQNTASGGGATRPAAGSLLRKVIPRAGRVEAIIRPSFRSVSHRRRKDKQPATTPPVPTLQTSPVPPQEVAYRPTEA